MLSRLMSLSTVMALGCVILITLCVGLPVSNADETDVSVCDIIDDEFGCGNNCEFTTDFRLEDCKFKHTGINPFFILKPGYRLVLEEPGVEKSVETVLRDTKKIILDGRRIKTRVVEERAIEWDDEEEEWLTVEISLNWFAICKKTNAVYYFGEWSRDCEDGFDENDVCTGEENNEGSWEAGVDGAMPGLIMPGTPLLGAKYFQEIYLGDEENHAVDRGQIMEVGVKEGPLEGCVKIGDTNPAESEDGGCDPYEDEKVYCPGVGLVQDQELKLVWSGFVDLDDEDEDDDDD